MFWPHCRICLFRNFICGRFPAQNQRTMAAEVACPDRVFQKRHCDTYQLIWDLRLKDAAGIGVCAWGRVTAIIPGTGMAMLSCFVSPMKIMVILPRTTSTFFEVVRVRGVLTAAGEIYAHELEVNPIISPQDCMEIEPPVKIRCVK